MSEPSEFHSEAASEPSESFRPVIQRSSPVAWGLFLLTLLLGGGATYYLSQRLDQERADAEAARKATRDVASSLHQAEEARRALEAEAAKLHEKDQGLAAERDALSQTVQEREAQLLQLRGTFDTLQDRLRAEIKKGDVHLTEVNGKIRVDLVDQILFDSGQATLSGRGGEVLSRVGAVLAQVADRQIQVSGHTDDSPISEKLTASFPSNWELSVSRAVNVVRYLTDHAQVPAKRLVAAGYGPYQPIASNATAQGRARNRRIEILLMPPLAATKANLAVASTEATPAVFKKGGPKKPVLATTVKKSKPSGKIAAASARKGKGK